MRTAGDLCAKIHQQMNWLGQQDPMRQITIQVPGAGPRTITLREVMAYYLDQAGDHTRVLCSMDDPRLLAEAGPQGDMQLLLAAVEAVDGEMGGTGSELPWGKIAVGVGAVGLAYLLFRR